MKIAVSSYSFQRLIREGQETQLSCIRLAKELGYEGIEFTELTPHDGSSPAEYAKKIARECERYDLPVTNYTVGADFLTGSAGALDAEVERVKQQVDIAQALGTASMRHDATTGFDPATRKQQGFMQALPRLAEGCRRITEYAAAKGIRTMIENHGFFCQDSARVEQLVNTVENPNFGLLLDMGLGKTVSVLSAIAALRFDYCMIGKTLVIAPLKVAEDTWQAEARKWDGLQGLTFSTVLGSEVKRKAALQVNADVYVINRENVSWLADQYRYRLPFDVCVVDESSSFKNPSSRRFKALRKCLGSFKRVYILTGTPSPNTLMDLWAQVYLLDHGERLGQTITAYRQQYFLPGQSNGHVVYNWRLRDDAAKQAIYDHIQDICMSLSAADYLQLPPRISAPSGHLSACLY